VIAVRMEVSTRGTLAAGEPATITVVTTEKGIEAGAYTPPLFSST